MFFFFLVAVYTPRGIYADIKYFFVYFEEVRFILRAVYNPKITVHKEINQSINPDRIKYLSYPFSQFDYKHNSIKLTQIFTGHNNTVQRNQFAGVSPGVHVQTAY